MAKSDRRRAHLVGLAGEWIAALFLMVKLYRILAWRLKTPVGELDLIARQGDCVVFVEVKLRWRREDEGGALASANRRRIARAASYFLAHHPRLVDNSKRFDVIFLAPWSWPRHVRNAFDGE